MTVIEEASPEQRVKTYQCKGGQHWWDNTDDHGYFYNGGKAHDDIYYWLCQRCETFKAEMVKFEGRRDVVVARYYKYPEWYRNTADDFGGETPTRSHFRYLMRKAMEGRLGEPTRRSRQGSKNKPKKKLQAVA